MVNFIGKISTGLRSQQQNTATADPAPAQSEQETNSRLNRATGTLGHAQSNITDDKSQALHGPTSSRHLHGLQTRVPHHTLMHSESELPCTTSTTLSTAPQPPQNTVTTKDLPADYLAAHDFSLVIVPSIDFNEDELSKIPGVEYYEQRQLYHLLKLKDPSVNMTFVSSCPVDPAIVGYYLKLNAEGPNLHDCLSRLTLVSPNDRSPLPLTEKVLSRPLLTKFIKDVSHNNNTASSGLSVFTGSKLETALAEQLHLKLLESGDENLHWGTKQGSHEIFAVANVACPPSTPSPRDEDLLSLGQLGNEPTNDQRYIRSAAALARGIARQILAHPPATAPKKWVVKLNQGFSGKGNALLDLSPIAWLKIHATANPLERENLLTDAIQQQFPNMDFQDKAVRWGSTGEHPSFEVQIERLGVIGEAFMDNIASSPSVQGIVEQSEEGTAIVHIVSTHEQLLHGQIYEGCIFPANAEYRAELIESGKRIGAELAKKGVIGHFAVDFLALNNTETNSKSLQAIEINLRQSGTTHPYAALVLLTGGKPDNTGKFQMPDGTQRHYTATDTLRSEELIGLRASDLIHALENRADPMAREVHWNQTEQTGAVFHLFGTLEPYGKIGFTAIEASPEKAKALFEKTVAFVHHVAQTKKTGG